MLQIISFMKFLHAKYKSLTINQFMDTGLASKPVDQISLQAISLFVDD